MKVTRTITADAVQFNGQNHLDITKDYWPEWLHHAVACGGVALCGDYAEVWREDLSSTDRCELGGWIIRDEDGLITTCSPRDFYDKYARNYD